MIIWRATSSAIRPFWKVYKFLIRENEEQSGGLTLQPVRQARLYISIQTNFLSDRAVSAITDLIRTIEEEKQEQEMKSRIKQ